MQENEDLIRNFIKSWSGLDADEIANFFAIDGIYHNMPTKPVQGRENINKFIAKFIENWTSTEWDVITLFSSGNVVVAERLDRTNAGGKLVDLPCCGIFEIENGQIKIWRDYFDMATYTRPFT